MNYDEFKYSLFLKINKAFVNKGYELVPGRDIRVQSVVCETFYLESKDKRNVITNDGKDDQLPVNEKNPERNEQTVSRSYNLSFFYEYYIQGITIDELVSCLKKDLKLKRTDPDSYFESFDIFNRVKNRIAYKFTSRNEKNKFKDKIPSTRFLDLSVMYFLIGSLDKGGMKTLYITNLTMEGWGVGRKEIDECARANTERLLPSTMIPLSDLMDQLEGRKPSNELSAQPMVYVLSNKMNIGGAAAVLYENLLKKVYTILDGEYYVLPCSIHEMIILAAGNSDEIYLKNLVHNVNTSCIDDNDFLSDNIYRYDSKCDELKIVA
ncbi:MAG: DUF5688 family protein [Lachnospiraceae bacterium]|jgi:hypothetical protein|nr:DUF5688 family protein [Lachnospiraceae bacterium]MEE3462087.1 DUF5688 family protein [Lachnospiraceae bacterium]